MSRGSAEGKPLTSKVLSKAAGADGLDANEKLIIIHDYTYIQMLFMHNASESEDKTLGIVTPSTTSADATLTNS